MYVRQNKNHLAYAHNGYAGFGQIPTNSVTVTHPGTGASVTLTGPVNETGQAVAVVGILNSAVSGAKSGQIDAAMQMIAKANGMIPALGSLSGEVSKMSAAAQQAVGMAKMSMSAGAQSAPPSGPNPMLIAGGIAAVVLVLVLVLKR